MTWTLWSKAQQCHGHCGVKLSSVIEHCEVKLSSVIKQSKTPWCQWHHGVKNVFLIFSKVFLVVFKIFSQISNFFLSYKRTLQWHCGAWSQRIVYETEESYMLLYFLWFMLKGSSNKQYKGKHFYTDSKRIKFYINNIDI